MASRIVYNFYLENAPNPFWQEVYKVAKDTMPLVPSVPRKGDKVALGDNVYMVMDSPTHYFDRVHEVAFVLREISLANAEEEIPVVTPVVAPFSVTLSSGPCRYCGDPECPGGEDCNFFDGSMG